MTELSAQQVSLCASAQALPWLRVQISALPPHASTGCKRIGFQETVPVRGRAAARKHVLAFWRAGYWCEVYDDESGELLAGPFDPNKVLPSYTV